MYRLLCCFQVSPLQRAQLLFARRILTGRRVVCNAQQLVRYPRHCRDDHNGKGLSRLSAMPRDNMRHAPDALAAADRGSSTLKDTHTTLHETTPVTTIVEAQTHLHNSHLFPIHLHLPVRLPRGSLPSMPGPG